MHIMAISEDNQMAERLQELDIDTGHLSKLDIDTFCGTLQHKT